MAIELYYRSQGLLFNADIKTLFPGIGSAKVQQLKTLAKAKTAARGGIQYNSRTVNTKDAYETWGLDIVDLEKQYAKLREYGLEE